MYTLKGIFPEPKKEQKKNFIRENMKQLKNIQSKSFTKEPKFIAKKVHQPQWGNTVGATSSLGQVNSSSSKSVKLSPKLKEAISPPNTRNLLPGIKKGDMSEFLKRKEKRQSKQREDQSPDSVAISSTQSSGHLRDIACQTIESNVSQKLAESTKLMMLYPNKESDDSVGKMKACGDTVHHVKSPTARTPRRNFHEDHVDMERHRSRLNAILERTDHKDPYLPSGYQKGVVPKYLRERKEQGPAEADGLKTDDDPTVCPPGHVILPDVERKETLRMLRNSFAELVSELNKLPVKTDTLKMRNRKIELEKQLAKLEEGIKVFSRPKVFVKIGE